VDADQQEVHVADARPHALEAGHGRIPRRQELDERRAQAQLRSRRGRAEGREERDGDHEPRSLGQTREAARQRPRILFACLHTVGHRKRRASAGGLEDRPQPPGMRPPTVED
jgi:hypothetical protein